MKVCSGCKKLLSLDLFSNDKNAKDGKKYACKKCISEREKDYQKEYRTKNKEKCSQANKKWYENNKESEQEKDRQYYQLNKKKINTRKNTYNKKRRKENPCFKLRHLISNAINYALKTNESCKNNVSCFKYLLYTTQELKEYIESLFEPWMTWQNQGRYNLDTWKDEDQLTWTWNIDHIIPQSNLPYTSMEDDNFKKCWELSNLRPYSAKQNCLDGVNKTRHNDA